MPRTVRIRKRAVVIARPKLCHCKNKKKCSYPQARGRAIQRRKINTMHLRKWNQRAGRWVAQGRGLLNARQKANWDQFRAGFKEGFHKVLDPVTRIATPFLNMIPGEGPLIAAGLNGINGLIPR